MPVVRYFFRFDLRRLILALTVVSVLVTLGNSYYSIYHVQKKLLIEQTLAANQVYATKLAESADVMLRSAEKVVAYSAQTLQQQGMSQKHMDEEVARLVSQADMFNSAVVVDANATIVAVYPDTLALKNTQLSPASRQSFDLRLPLITKPFFSPSGNTLVSVSHPIWSSSGSYLGYVSGTIYLNKLGSLTKLLQSRDEAGASYFFVVDEDRTLIFHRDLARVGQTVSDNRFIDEVLMGRIGQGQGLNSQGIEMIAGYAPIESSGWGVVAQSSLESTMAALRQQMQDVFIRSLPLALVTLAGIWLSAMLIARPLRQLASNVGRVNDKDLQQRILDIRSWYFEATQLKMAILHGIGLFNERIHKLDSDSNTDPLTRLSNRRGMQKYLDEFAENHSEFAVIALDIDHFKKVNDTFGHGVGDMVIARLADIMRRHATDGDVLCRIGGEEFLMFLPNTDMEEARYIAEGLRQDIADSKMPKVRKITVSLGVSLVKPHPDNKDIDIAIKNADAALYQAKNDGRNCTRVYPFSVVTGIDEKVSNLAI